MTSPEWDRTSALHLLLATLASPDLTEEQLETVMPDLRELAEAVIRRGHPVNDDELSDVHDPRCKVWRSPDPTDVCDCGADQFNTGFNQLLEVFERHAPRNPS